MENDYPFESSFLCEFSFGPVEELVAIGSNARTPAALFACDDTL